jgi:hypothetical protein
METDVNQLFRRTPETESNAKDFLKRMQSEPTANPRGVKRFTMDIEHGCGWFNEAEDTYTWFFSTIPHLTLPVDEWMQTRAFYPDPTGVY